MSNKTKGTKEWATRNINVSKNGCPFDCQYCYSRCSSHRYNRTNWDNWSSSMINKDDMLLKTFRPKSINNLDIIGPEYDVMFPTSHDITAQNLHLAKAVCMNMVRANLKVLIVTKADLYCIRVLSEHLKDYKQNFTWRISITTKSEKLKKIWEPGAPKISIRLQVLKELYEGGFTTSVSIEPFLDKDPRVLINLVDQWVNEKIWVGPMNETYIILGAKKLWGPREKFLYSINNLLLIRDEILSLNNPKVVLKDLFQSKLDNLQTINISKVLAEFI